MADNVAVTAGSGTTIAADEVVDGTLGTVKVQYVKIMDATLDGTTKAAVGANGLAVDVKALPTLAAVTTVSTVTNLAQLGGAAIAMGTGVRSAGTQRVTVATDDNVPVTLTAETTKNIGTVRMGDGTNTAAVKAASTAPVATDPAVVVAISPNTQNANGTTTDANSTPVAWSTEGKAQIGAVGETAPVSDTASSGLNGRLQRIAQRITSLIALWTTTGLSNRAFSVAFATLTRPANTTAYTAADSISDNATAGSVTALVSGNISDTNNDPIFLSDILVNSTDTGLAGKKIRAYVYNSDPTASTGVGGGDNAAFANKKAGYLGSFMGWMETGFSDGTVGRLVPCFNETNFTQAGGFIVVPPVSGARTLYIQYQAVEAFTPSANSTTIIGTARGWQGRAV